MLKWIISTVLVIAVISGGVLLMSQSHKATQQAAYANSDAVTVFKTPWCGCCSDWVEHLQDNGFDVNVVVSEDLVPVRHSHKVPDELASCHTAKIGRYAIEGHVPATDIRRLLREQPNALGLSVPGMPAGSPGMEVKGRSDPYEVIIFKEDGTEVFSRHNQTETP